MGPSRKPLTIDELTARAAARGYQRGIHAEKDRLRKQGTYRPKGEKNQDATLRRYILWTLVELRDTAARQGLPPPDEAMAYAHCLRPGMDAPDLAIVKDFIRFYAATSDPRIDDEMSTVDSLCTVAEWFFAGFTRVTKTEINEKDRKEVYHHIRTALVEEGLAVKKHRPKYNFVEDALTRFQVTLWTKDDLIFIPERYRVQTTFITNVYCWTGARISAFFTGGLRYRDTEIALQRTDGSRGWRAIWKLDQRWVKNNRDPENIVFGTAHKEHEKLIYNETWFLIQMAIADGALFGIDSIDDLLRKQITPGDDVLVLRYNESALDKPILRKCTKAGGVTEEPMPKAAFEAIWKSTCCNAGLFQIPTIHAIRRGLGEKVDKNYTPVQRSQHLTQADPRVFGQSYVAHCSSVDGQGAFLGESSDHRHIDYFRSVLRFLEPGLPTELPARRQDELSRDSQLCELQERLAALQHEDSTGPLVGEARRCLSNYRRKLYKKSLSKFQKQWVRDRRDWKILSDGKERPKDRLHTDLVDHLSLLIPERGRLAQWMAQDEPLSPESMWQAMRDLHSLCTRDLTVLYLPGLNPLDGRCPVQSCQILMDELPKNQRNRHVQSCVRDDMAKKLHRLPSHIHYCHLCFDWVVGEDEWESHCASHLSSLATTRCGTLSYGYTLVRPGYSPFRLGNVKLTATQRLQSWSRDFKLWTHVNEELQGCRWPMSCPHPLCRVALKDARDLQFHFIDDHKCSRTRPMRRTDHSERLVLDSVEETTADEGLRYRKRRACGGDTALEWRPFKCAPLSTRTEPPLPARPPKRARFTGPTISPTLLSIIDLTDDHAEKESDVPVLPVKVDLTTVDPRDAELRCDANDLFPGQDWLSDDERSMDGCSTSSLSDDSLFSHTIRSTSSPRSSNDLPRSYMGSDTTASKEASNFGVPSDAVDDDSHFETLFSQYLRSRSPSPPTSPGQAGTCHVGGGLRLRLRVRQPKIMLRLKLQEPGKIGRKGMTRGMKKEPTRRGTAMNGTRREKEGKGTRRQGGKKEKKAEPIKTMNATDSR